MQINSKYNKSFISNSLTKSKYNELHDFAVLIKEHKNFISKEVNSNLLFYLELNFFDFLKVMRSKYKGVIPSNFDKQLYEDVFTSYQNKFNNLTKSIRFEKITSVGFECYKRDSKNNKKRRIKECYCQERVHIIIDLFNLFGKVW